jgi:hypothetical protein
MVITSSNKQDQTHLFRTYFLILNRHEDRPYIYQNYSYNFKGTLVSCRAVKWRVSGFRIKVATSHIFTKIILIIILNKISLRGERLRVWHFSDLHLEVSSQWQLPRRRSTLSLWLATLLRALIAA